MIDFDIEDFEKVEKMCDWHKPLIMDFLPWQDECRERYEDGYEQKKCHECGYWLFEDEMGRKPY